jgi:hypothetical protein
MAYYRKVGEGALKNKPQKALPHHISGTSNDKSGSIKDYDNDDRFD